MTLTLFLLILTIVGILIYLLLAKWDFSALGVFLCAVTFIFISFCLTCPVQQLQVYPNAPVLKNKTEFEVFVYVDCLPKQETIAKGTYTDIYTYNNFSNIESAVVEVRGNVFGLAQTIYIDSLNFKK